MKKTMINTNFENVISKQKASLISGPFGSNISSKYFVDAGIPVIRGNNLSLDYDKFIDSGFVFVTEEKADELKCDAFTDDILFTAAGTIGQVGIVPQDTKFPRYVISNKQIRARVDASVIDPLYAYYWLSSPWIQKMLQNNDKGSTVPLLTLNEIRNLPISYPEDLNYQKKVASFIDLFSKTIENNEKTISRLETIMHKAFQLWFVQYEFETDDGKPYLSNGGQLEYNDELKRKIPVGWRVTKLSEIVAQKKRRAFVGNNEKTIDLSIMPSGTSCIAELNNSNNFSTNLFELAEGDILFGSIRPYLKKCCISPIDGAFAGTIHNFREKNRDQRAFIYSLVSSDFFFDYAVTVSKGTKMPVVGATDLFNYKVPFCDEIANKFNKFDFTDEICRIINENIALKTMRAKLLPLLFSGKVSLCDSK